MREGNRKERGEEDRESGGARGKDEKWGDRKRRGTGLQIKVRLHFSKKQK